MVHNWYLADECGKYQATYRVYVGDAVTGIPLPAFSSDIVTLYWQYVPDENLGDMNGDTDIDTHDLAQLQRCYTGVGPRPMPAICGCADFDGDDDVDFADFSVAAAAFGGPSQGE